MNLAEEFTLLAYADDGTPEIDATHLDHGLGGALLLELALAERLAVRDGKVAVRSAASIGDALLDDALGRIAADAKHRNPGHWVREFAKGTRDRALDALVSRGVLRRDRGRVLWVFHRTTYPAAHGVEPVAEAEARQRMRSAMTTSGAVEARTAALCALVAATGLDRKVFADLDHKRIKARLKEISQGAWAAEAVKRTIAEVQAAVTTAVIAATTVSTASTT